MKEKNIILKKSYAFALEIMSLAKTIREQREYALASQLWRSSTSIGANVKEARGLPHLLTNLRNCYEALIGLGVVGAEEILFWILGSPTSKAWRAKYHEIILYP